MTEHPEGLIEGSGVAGDAKAFSVPHKIYVEKLDKLGAIQVWCGCSEGGVPGTVFEEEGLPALLLFLESHSR